MHHVEQFRGTHQTGREWILLKAFSEEAAAIGFYLQIRADFPQWKVRRITVHECSP